MGGYSTSVLMWKTFALTATNLLLSIDGAGSYGVRGFPQGVPNRWQLDSIWGIANLRQPAIFISDTHVKRTYDLKLNRPLYALPSVGGGATIRTTLCNCDGAQGLATQTTAPNKCDAA